MGNIKYNLFYHAKKELSQDAFIAWVCSNYDNENDKELKNFSHDFLKDLFKIELSDGDKLEVKKQESDIDILLRCDDKIVIIEDKVNTQEHDGQLGKYKNKVRERYGDSAEISCFYYKTGHLFKSPSDIPLSIKIEKCKSEAERVKNNDFEIIDRKRVIAFLNSHKVSNPIIQDYCEYINYFDQQFNEFPKENFSEENNCQNPSWGKIMDDIAVEILKKNKDEKDLYVSAKMYSGMHYSLKVFRYDFPWFEINSKVLDERCLYIYNNKDQDKKRVGSEEKLMMLFEAYKNKYQNSFKENNRYGKDGNQLFRINLGETEDSKLLEKLRLPGNKNSINVFKKMVIEKVEEYIEFTK